MAWIQQHDASEGLAAARAVLRAAQVQGFKTTPDGSRRRSLAEQIEEQPA